MSVLFPRLRSADGRRILADIATADLKTLEQRSATNHDAVFHAPTGGSPVTEAALALLRQRLHEIACNAGYPEDSARSRSTFDEQVAIHLPSLWPGITGDALRADSWSFVAVVLVPHLVKWRFPKANDRRYCGSLVRNAIGRLWLTGMLLDRGEGQANRWQLVSEATEDFLLQLIERPSVSAYPALALEIAEEWYCWKQRLTSSKLEELNRLALIRLRMRAALICPEAISGSVLRAFVADTYAETYGNLVAAGSTGQPN